MRNRCAVVLWVALVGAGAARAEEPEVGAVRASYEYGRYAEVLERAQARVDRGRLSEEELVELHKLAGVSAFNLQRPEVAERHFRALLRLQPDFALDPFVVPPPAVALLDDIRQRMAAELDVVRQERRLRLERERTEAERREQERVQAEQQRRQWEEQARQVTVRRVEKRSFLVNFVPFGAGQFQQGRNGLGTVFAATEGALAVASVISYFAYESLFEQASVLVDDVQTDTGKASITVRYIPTARAREANTWRLLKYGSAVGFYAVYALGVADAIFHHQDQVVESSIETLPEPVRPPAAPSGDKAPSARLHLLLAPGGAGAGLSFVF